MGTHINKDGEFQSDKYPTCPAGKVPLSTKDPMAQEPLAVYSERRRSVDSEFSDDLDASLRAKGFDVEAFRRREAARREIVALVLQVVGNAECLTWGDHATLRDLCKVLQEKP